MTLPDYPATTKWLSDAERKLAISRLIGDEGEHDSGEILSHKQAFFAAVKDPKTWVSRVTSKSGAVAELLATRLSSSHIIC